MHLLKHKPKKEKPFIPIRHIFEVPEFRRLHGRRYDKDGKFVCVTGLKNQINEIEQRAVIAAKKAGRKKGKPIEHGKFDVTTFTPARNRVLLKRPPQITEEKGVQLPEEHYRSQPWFYVVRIGPEVTVCKPGDRVIIQKKHRAVPVWIDAPFHFVRETGIAAIVDGPPISLAAIIR
jgi:hypothetical protein